MQISPINKPYGQELSTVGADPILLSTIEKGRVAASEISISDTAKVIDLLVFIDPGQFIFKFAPVTFNSPLQHTEANFNAIIELYTMLIDTSLLLLVYEYKNAKTTEDVEHRKSEAKGIYNFFVELLTILDSAEGKFKNSAYYEIKRIIEKDQIPPLDKIISGYKSVVVPSSDYSTKPRVNPSVQLLLLVVALAYLLFYKEVK